MHKFYAFTGEGDSLMVVIDTRNENVMITLGNFEMEIDVDSAMELADLLIDAASEVTDGQGD